jgi:hypothetical protein
MSRINRPISVLVAMLTMCAAASAQTTVQEVLDAGGKRLTTEELQKIMPHMQMTGKMSQGYETDFKLDKDGTFKGKVFPLSGETPVYGWWRIKDNNYCMDMNYPKGKNNFCNSVFELNGKYFVSGESGKPEGNVQQRVFKPL